VERERGCLGDDSVVRFHLGRLDSPALTSIERHVDGCATCALLIMPSGSQPAARRFHGAHALSSGDVVGGRYRIERLLGGGGMGEVYAAFDEQLGERVALKTVRATIADDARAIARLKSEVQLARRVTHPNVCRIYDLGTHAPASDPGKQLAFLTMELLPGRTLADEIRHRGPFPDETASRVLRQLVAGLAAAHKAGVIHKDFKSDNVILVSAASGNNPFPGDARVVITDFGLAATEESMAADDRRFEFSGTPGYIAPERLRGAPATAASDVYSLGVVLLDMLEGRVPAGPPSPEVAPTAASSAGLRAVVARCCDGAPAARPTIAALAALLTRVEQQPRRRSLRAASLVGAAALVATTIGLSLRRAPALPARPAPSVVAAVPTAPAPETAAPAVLPERPSAPDDPEPAARPSRRVPAPRRRPAPAELTAAVLSAELGDAPPRRPAREQPSVPAAAERQDEPIRTLAAPSAPDDAVIDPFAARR
jgi:serine/threonine protein kinase